MNEQELQEMRESIRAIHQCLIGYNGDPGLVQEFAEVRADHYRLRRTVICLIAFMIGSGLLIGGGIGISQWLGG